VSRAKHELSCLNRLKEFQRAGLHFGRALVADQRIAFFKPRESSSAEAA
jgi:hypothetical protein